jgi:hypothetical protein
VASQDVAKGEGAHIVITRRDQAMVTAYKTKSQATLCSPLVTNKQQTVPPEESFIVFTFYGWGN